MIVKQNFVKLFKDEAGAFAILFAFVFAMLVGITGAAVDYARGHLLKSELSSALDAAALAAGSTANSDNMEEVAQKYFDVNFPDGYMGAIVGDIEFENSGDKVRLNLDASLNYTLLGAFVPDLMNFDLESEVTLETKGMEIALVMDNTGSMNGSKITTMKNAAQGLVDILYGDESEIDNLWVSLVPFTAAVNIGKENTSWVSGLDQNEFYPTTWKGCVEARLPNEMNDNTPAGGGLWTPYLYEDASDNNWKCDENCSISTSSCGSSSGKFDFSSGGVEYAINENQCARNDGEGPNLGCPPPITPLTKSRAEVTAAISEMDAWHRGGTFSNLGLSWGWRTISPKWQGLWSGLDAAQPFDYGEPLVDKVVVILTDGGNNVYDHNGGGPLGSDYTAYGRIEEEKIGAGINTKNEGNTAINTQFSATCELMKSEGIIIYTITFATNDNSIKTTYRNCATSAAYYFDSPSNNELDDVFEAIGDSLSNLRISK